MSKTVVLFLLRQIKFFFTKNPQKIALKSSQGFRPKNFFHQKGRTQRKKKEKNILKP